MAENKLADLSMAFAVEILNICDGIKGHYSIVNQLERSATKQSIGLNLCKEQEFYLMFLCLCIIAELSAKCLFHPLTPLNKMSINKFVFEFGVI